jgi:hypothetical protein
MESNMEPPKPLEPHVRIIVSAIGVLITLVWLAVSYLVLSDEKVRLTSLRVLLALGQQCRPSGSCMSGIDLGTRPNKSLMISSTVRPWRAICG